jgi:CelD/BcsL family acetyltransferase involved in cellulose biosynthesis
VYTLDVELRCAIAGVEELPALLPAWRELAAAAAAPDATLLPEWTLALADLRPYTESLRLAVVRDRRGELVAIAPLALRLSRLCGALPARVLSTPGALLLGPQLEPPTGLLLARPEAQAAATTAMVHTLLELQPRHWDALELFAVDEQAPARTLLAAALSACGIELEAQPAGGVPTARLGGSYDSYADALSRIGRPAPRLGVGDLGDGLRRSPPGQVGALVALLRRQAAARGDPLPPLGAAAVSLADRFAEAGSLRLAVVESAGRPVAGLMGVRTGSALTLLVRALDPDAVHAAASDALVADELREAASAGLETVRLPRHDPLVERFATGSRRVYRLRAFTRSPAGRALQVRQVVLERAAPPARAALARLRGAAAARGERPAARGAEGTAGLIWLRLGLYRGRVAPGAAPPQPGVTTGAMSLGAFDALAPARRLALCAALELSEPYCRQKWARGDLVVRADLEGEPAGILWCARNAVFVPEIDREVRPGQAACYIHDVFVAPWARGRAVAPALLAQLHEELARDDVALAWALIHRDNAASARAFEKAAFTRVCDVLFARFGRASRVLVRPRDREALRLLGL